MKCARPAVSLAGLSLLVLLWSFGWLPACLRCRQQATGMILSERRLLVGKVLTYGYSTGETLAGGSFVDLDGSFRVGDRLMVHFNPGCQKESFVSRFPYSAGVPLLAVFCLLGSLSWLLVAPEVEAVEPQTEIGFESNPRFL
ncbi:hypothetical protein JST97_02310 [bacterium]|nr:hypothetical protein [bacterium]